MLGWLVLLFVAMPFIELYLLIQIGQRIGFWPTLGIVLGTGLLGGLLVRWQGLRAWRDVLGALREGRAPKVELAAGALFLAAAAMLLTPGVLTDAFGFTMMVPPIRRAAARYLVDRVGASDRVQTYVSVGGGPFGAGSRGPEEGARQGYDLEATGYTRDPEEPSIGAGEEAEAEEEPDEPP